MFQTLMLARALNEELTSSPPQPPPCQCIAVKTSYIDMSSRFTAPHCLGYYQAINPRAGMNWLTLRVASVASCNLIAYIKCPSSSFSPLKHTGCQINAAFLSSGDETELQSPQKLEKNVSRRFFPGAQTRSHKCSRGAQVPLYCPPSLLVDQLRLIIHGL